MGERFAGVVGVGFVWMNERVVGVWGVGEFGRLCICRKGERVSNHFERSESAFYKIILAKTCFLRFRF